jgi:hypothetical protein
MTAIRRLPSRGAGEGYEARRPTSARAAPTPHLDTSHDAIDAAVRVLRLKPSDSAITQFVDQIILPGRRASPSAPAPAAMHADGRPSEPFPADDVRAGGAFFQGENSEPRLPYSLPPTLAALDGASASDPIVRSLARSGSTHDSGDDVHLVAADAITRDLIGDEVRGGHTIETHVGKSQGDLADRLEREPGLRAASTYRNLPEAAEITQQVIDLNRDQINSWIANPTAAKRLVVSVSRPITSSRYVPIGIVVVRGERIPVPGNGARVVLEKRSNALNDFSVVTSYPTFSGLPGED